MNGSSYSVNNPLSIYCSVCMYVYLVDNLTWWMFQIFEHNLPAKKTLSNRADPDQTASNEANLSGSSLFTILTSISWFPALITNIKLLEKRKIIAFEVLEHLLYRYFRGGSMISGKGVHMYKVVGGFHWWLYLIFLKYPIGYLRMAGGEGVQVCPLNPLWIRHWVLTAAVLLIYCSKWNLVISGKRYDGEMLDLS